MKNKIIKSFKPTLSKNSQEVVKKRYLRVDENGRPLETPAEMFYRTAHFMAQADLNYLTRNEKRRAKSILNNTTSKFYKLLASLKFLPGGRTLFEAGNKHLGQFSSCFVVPIKDSIKSIFESLSNAAIIQQHNGGTGFNFSNIRPKNDVVRGIPNVAAGPIHYIKTYDTALSRVLQGSKRHGANMGILNVDHPDIFEFINLKSKGSELKNFNLSVGVTADFMEKVRKDEDYELINPRTKKPVKSVRAKEVFDLIVQRAWACGDPGIIFLDRLDEANPTPHLGHITATNPCGEQPLLPYEACNLGSINFSQHIKNGKIDWADLKKTIFSAVHFMDNVIDLNEYPLSVIKKKVQQTRKIGLGLMGFAHGLYKLGIPYNSNEAVKLAERLMKFIRDNGRRASIHLAKKRGVFPAYKGSIYEKMGIKMRNATITTIAPTGTVSMVADTSAGIEPVFSLVTMRRMFYESENKNQAGRTVILVDPIFEETLKSKKFYSKKLIEKILEEGSIQKIKEIPEKYKKVFVTAHDISPVWHVKIQAAFQKYTDNAVSKTINFSQYATIEDVRKAYIKAYELGCKGITIYRDKSKQEQVLSLARKEPLKLEEQNKREKEELDSKKTEIKLTKNAMMVLEKRALKKDKDGRVIETPDQLFKRVAKFIASADKKYPAFRKNLKKTENEFYKMMKNLEFISGQALRNAGDPSLSLSACFVLPIEDSIEGILKAMNENTLVHKSTCGTGINFSPLRSRNSQVGSTKELASGPVAFMKAFNAIQETIRTKGGRKQGSMVILNINHPDIEEFIKAKDKPGELINFNISVGITSDFMKALEKDEDYSLIDPHTKKVVKKIKAKKLFDLIAEHAWRSGDPGVIFLDRIEKDNPTPTLGKLEATNPCGEQPLLPYETCNLGSIVLSNMVKYEKGKAKIDYSKLRKVVRLGVHFLDNTLDLNRFPLPQMKKMSLGNRKIGLGVMGFADMLIKLDIPYNSEKAAKVAEKIMKFISEEAHKASQWLGEKKGSFPNFKKSIWFKKGVKAMRNAAVTTIAPTGYTAIVANCSSGIEPIFALAFQRENVMGGMKQFEVHPLFEDRAKREGFYSKELMEKITRTGSIQKLKEVPEHIKKIFVTSHDISPDWDLKIQAAFQKYTDNAVSKTINFPKQATKEDIARVYKKAYQLGCKGITIYRDGSKESQVLSRGTDESSKKSEIKKDQPFPLKPRSRPEIVQGRTYELKTAYGGLYVTINDDEEKKPFEVFATIGKTGGFFAADSEAICRLISLALRSGVPAYQVVKQLKGIRGPMPSWTKRGTVLSIPDAIAKILEEHIKKDQTKLPFEGEMTAKKDEEKNNGISSFQKEAELDDSDKKKEEDSHLEKLNKEHHAIHQKKEKSLLSIADIGHAPECPDCGGILEFGEGCVTCRACGYSKCG